jgi:uncharacterized protein DUF2695
VDVATYAEGYLAELQTTLTAPRDRECLVCYLRRAVDEFGCDGTLRWSLHWRDACAPRAVALADRLADRGGFCDCEVLLNVHPSALPEDGPAAPCVGVSRRGSTQPCRRPPTP